MSDGWKTEKKGPVTFSPAEEDELDELMNFCISESSQMSARFDDLDMSGSIPKKLKTELVRRLKKYMTEQKAKDAAK